MKDGFESWNAKACSDLEQQLIDADETALQFNPSSKFLSRWLNWEFWPQKLLYVPVYLMDYTLAFGHLNPVYFANANPRMTYGGMFGCSKTAIADLLPDTVQPKYMLLKKDIDPDKGKTRIKESSLRLPLILKPDRGDRGIMVRKCKTWDEVETYLHQASFDVMVQEYVDAPLEFGVFCLKEPKSGEWKISSVTFKKRMHIIGDGKKSVKQLIMDHPRLRLFEKAISNRSDTSMLFNIPERDEVIEVVRFGNHSKGSMFLNAEELCASPLLTRMESICEAVEDFNYGRFDLLADSVQDLLYGRFQIIELNGALAEPTHIYDPRYPLWRGLKDLLWHHYKLFKIGQKMSRSHKNHPGTLRTLRDVRAFRRWEAKINSMD
jgi:hypothetical protein